MRQCLARASLPSFHVLFAASSSLSPFLSSSLMLLLLSPVLDTVLRVIVVIDAGLLSCQCCWRCFPRLLILTSSHFYCLLLESVSICFFPLKNCCNSFFQRRCIMSNNDSELLGRMIVIVVVFVFSIALCLSLRRTRVLRKFENCENFGSTFSEILIRGEVLSGEACLI